MKFDIIIIGATSFVGQRFIKYYSQYFKHNGVKVLATARNQSRLEKVLAGISHIESGILDVNDKETVFNTIEKGELVLNFAGPFDLYAENIVAACARLGVHYLDITGEVHFAKRMIDKYDQQAKASKAMIVPFGGFDSIPSDYAVYLASKCSECEADKIKSIDIVYKLKGGFNGGTVATAIDSVTKVSDYDMSNRNYLTQADDFIQKDSTKKRFISELGYWVSPFIMEPINSKVIYRSLFLGKRERFSDDFAYRESVRIPGGKLGNTFFVMSAAIGNKVFKNTMGRKLITAFLPNSGEGPSDEVINQGFIKSSIIVRMESGTRLKSSMYSAGDPGNKTTIKLLGAAMKAFLQKKTGESYGLLTPVTCFGENLVSFLSKEGVAFESFSRL